MYVYIYIYIYIYVYIYIYIYIYMYTHMCISMRRRERRRAWQTAVFRAEVWDALGLRLEAAFYFPRSDILRKEGSPTDKFAAGISYMAMKVLTSSQAVVREALARGTCDNVTCAAALESLYFSPSLPETGRRFYS